MLLGATVPVTLACALFSDDIVSVLLGRKWSATAPLFRLLAPTVIAFAIINPLGWLLFATGQIERSLRLAFVIAPVVIASYSVGLAFGPTGVACGFSAAMLLLTILFPYWALRGAVVSPGDVFSTVRPPVTAGLLAVLVTAPFASWLGHDIAPLLRLILELSVFVSCYAVLLLYPFGQRALYIDRPSRVVAAKQSRIQLETCSVAIEQLDGGFPPRRGSRALWSPWAWAFCSVRTKY